MIVLTKEQIESLRLMALSCLKRWANPRNKEACEDQLHIPETYEHILLALDTIAALESRNAQLEGALRAIASYEKGDTGCCPYGCDTPTIAKNALANQAPASKPDIEGLREKVAEAAYKYTHRGMLVASVIQWPELTGVDRDEFIGEADAILAVLRKEGRLP